MLVDEIVHPPKTECRDITRTVETMDLKHFVHRFEVATPREKESKKGQEKEENSPWEWDGA